MHSIHTRSGHRELTTCVNANDPADKYCKVKIKKSPTCVCVCVCVCVCAGDFALPGGINNVYLLYILTPPRVPMEIQIVGHTHTHTHAHAHTHTHTHAETTHAHKCIAEIFTHRRRVRRQQW